MEIKMRALSLKDEIEVFVRWPAREEKSEVCAKKIVAYLSKLQRISGAFDNWMKYPKSSKNAKAQKTIQWQVFDEIEALLINGQSRKDYPKREVMRELGFSIHLWNQDSVGINVGIVIRCGIYTPVTVNSATLTIRKMKSAGISNDQLVETLSASVEFFQAADGWIQSTSHTDEFESAPVYFARFSNSEYQLSFPRKQT
jgi:hypothetical protein